ncbi:MAG: ABC transporter substrate-binding protein [Ilumatobacteraceae bacterium]
MASSDDLVRVRFLRFSAFYGPVLVTIGGGHLAAEGLEATYDTVTPGRTVEDGIRDGVIDVAQSAVAVHFRPWTNRVEMPHRHFALVNRHDGFFLARRGAARPFDWDDLRGATIVADHFFQPMTLLKAALDALGMSVEDVHLVNAGTPAEMDEAFRAGVGDYVHMQSPAPHVLEQDGIATVVAAVGAETPELAFSSLCASSSWLAMPQAAAFTRAFRSGRRHAQSAPAEEVARIISPFLPGVAPTAVTAAVAAYQAMGTWTGDIAIDEPLYDATVALFQRHDDLAAGPPYDVAIAPPPAP